MIFECERKVGKHTVWNAKAQNVLCVFNDGVFETNDEQIIKMLKLYGYNAKNEEHKVVKEEISKSDNDDIIEIKPKRTYKKRTM